MAATPASSRAVHNRTARRSCSSSVIAAPGRSLHKADSGAQAASAEPDAGAGVGGAAAQAHLRADQFEAWARVDRIVERGRAAHRYRAVGKIKGAGNLG